MATWISERERESALLAQTGVFQAACQGKRMDEAGKLFIDSTGGSSVGIELATIAGGGHTGNIAS
ncbi:MAG: hypothetical protein HQK55_17710 [Deltaproteobacteria bacterium]|nr:hypothetical protein [Deltaproteobacteria bacterium]